MLAANAEPNGQRAPTPLPSPADAELPLHRTQPTRSMVPADQPVRGLAFQAASCSINNVRIAFENAYTEISDVTREWASLADAIHVSQAGDDIAASRTLHFEQFKSSPPQFPNSQGALLLLHGPAAPSPSVRAQPSPPRHEAIVSPPDARENRHSVISSAHAGVVSDETRIAAGIQAGDSLTEQHPDADTPSLPALRNQTIYRGISPPMAAYPPNAPSHSSLPGSSSQLRQPIRRHTMPVLAQPQLISATTVSNRTLSVSESRTACASPRTPSYPCSPRLAPQPDPHSPSAPSIPVPLSSSNSQSPPSNHTALPRVSSASSASSSAHQPLEHHASHHTQCSPTRQRDTLHATGTVRPDFPEPARASFATEVTVKAEPFELSPASTIAQLARHPPAPARHAPAPRVSVGAVAEAKQQQQLLAARARSTPRGTAAPTTIERTRSGGTPVAPPSTPTSDLTLPSRPGRDAAAAAMLSASSAPTQPFGLTAPPTDPTSGQAHASANQHPSSLSPSEPDVPALCEFHSPSFIPTSWATASSPAPVEASQYPQTAPEHPASPVPRHRHTHSPLPACTRLVHQPAAAGLPQKPSWPSESMVAGVAHPREPAVQPAYRCDPHSGTTGAAHEAAPQALARPDAAATVAAPLPTAGAPSHAEHLQPMDGPIERAATSESSRDRPAPSPASQLAVFHAPPSTSVVPMPAPDVPLAPGSGETAGVRRPSPVARSRSDRSPANAKSPHPGNSSNNSPSARASYEPPPVATRSDAAVRAKRSCSPASSDCTRSPHSYKPALSYRIRDATPSDEAPRTTRSPSPQVSSPGAHIPLVLRIPDGRPEPLVDRVGPVPEQKTKKRKRDKPPATTNAGEAPSGDPQPRAAKKRRR